MVVSLLPKEIEEFALIEVREFHELAAEIWLLLSLVTAIEALEEVDVIDALEEEAWDEEIIREVFEFSPLFLPSVLSILTPYFE